MLQKPIAEFQIKWFEIIWFQIKWFEIQLISNLFVWNTGKWFNHTVTVWQKFKGHWLFSSMKFLAICGNEWKRYRMYFFFKWFCRVLPCVPVVVAKAPFYKNKSPGQNMWVDVYSSIVHNSPKVKTTKYPLMMNG